MMISAPSEEIWLPKSFLRGIRQNTKSARIGRFTTIMFRRTKCLVCYIFICDIQGIFVEEISGKYALFYVTLENGYMEE